jgi:hypothetical protein
VEIDDPDDLADRCYWWAMNVLTAWEQYATAYLDRGGASRPKALVADLDRSSAATKVCKWFAEHGADSLVEKYKVFGKQSLARNGERTEKRGDPFRCKYRTWRESLACTSKIHASHQVHGDLT